MGTQLPRWVWVGGVLLACVGGMVNVIGYLGFEHQAVSHLTGTTSLLGAALAHGDWKAVAHLWGVLIAFCLGAMVSGMIIQDSTLRLGRRYGVVLALESLILFAAIPLFWIFIMHDYQRQRVLTFLNPETDPLGAGYHIIQSKIAIGSGGIYGKGWLNGTQSHLDFLPEGSTDFIFAAFLEEFGLVGGGILLTLYFFVIGRALYMASRAPDTYTRLLAGSLTLIFFLYAFVNTGMVSGLLPVVGLPLPLFSYGGTSLVTVMAGFGILMSIYASRRSLTR